jgi:Domain of unknown function (DUF1937)
MPGQLTYLACPYSHPDRAVRVARFEAANRAAAKLMAAGELVFSPISQCHPIAEAGGLLGDWSFWERYDRAMLDGCKRVVVLMLDGWRESTGIQAEIGLAWRMGLPVEYAEPEPQKMAVEPRSPLPAPTRPSQVPIASGSPTRQAAPAGLTPGPRLPFSVEQVNARCSREHTYPRGGAACWCGRRTRRLEEAMAEVLSVAG